YLVFFFVQAEDGIRDFHVTGVQTCALPISIVNGRPEVMDLKQTLLVFIEHRREVVSRRTRFELSQAEAQRELVEGLGMAITEVDLVIKTIRESRDPETAKARLMELPLKGLEEFVKRAGRPESEIVQARET